jgi:hypothetical protein
MIMLKALKNEFLSELCNTKYGPKKYVSITKPDWLIFF